MKYPCSKLINALPLLLIALISLCGCQKIRTCPVKEANLIISEISYEETSRKEIMDPPDGSYQPDNPNFDPRDPSTWTGNMAQYIKRYIKYTRSFNVYNAGTGTAFDGEVDLHIKYRSGTKSIETISVGKICPEEQIFRHKEDIIHTEEIKSVTPELYWYDD